jgi:NADH dehydrogenase
VTVHAGQAVTAIDDSGVNLGAARIASRTVLWAAGVAASPLGRQLGVDVDRAGRVRVNADLSVPRHPEIFVAGDLASVTRDNGQPYPAPRRRPSKWARMRGSDPRAPVGRQASTFRYRDYGNLATIGRWPRWSTSDA